LAEQLEILSKRIHQQTFQYLDACGPAETVNRPDGAFREGAILRLDLEPYFQVLARFFSLAANLLPIADEKLLEEPIVKQVRQIRNRIVEHGYEFGREGSRNFYCDAAGPKLISETGETDCPQFLELDAKVVVLFEKYSLTRDTFLNKYTRFRGPELPS
jgi:hypothetical protein